MTVSGTYPGSDAILKSNVEYLTNALEVINQIDPKVYTFNVEEFPQLDLPQGNHAGVIAQEIEEILPGIVKQFTIPAEIDGEGNVITNEVTFKGVNYTEIIPYLIGAINEQQVQIEVQSTQITELTVAMSQCCAAILEERSDEEQSSFHQKDIKLLNQLQPILYQNQPNPNKGLCTIKYFLPEESSDSEIQFFDHYGNLLRIVPITQTGMGQINVDASDLVSGIYSYVLFVHGEIIDTKKMMKE